MPGPEEQGISPSFISHLRQSSRISCPMPGCDEAYPAIDERIREHFWSKHTEITQGKDIPALIRDVKKGRIPKAQGVESSSTRDQGTANEAAASSHKRRKSPVTSPSKQSRPRSNSPSRRSRARPQQGTNTPDPDFLRRGPQQGKLWNPEGDSTSSPDRTKQNSPKPPDEDSDTLRLIKQPKTRPISQEQLIAEVKGIYAGLMMVESKCIEVVNAQKDIKLNNEQWQALIALHRTLLHEHHDFLLASQHPSASQALKQLASKYAMPARMWRHGIHSFLELLRHHLPESLEHMLTFIYLAYPMIALLYEAVPAFEDTWIECLGDLGRYRMAIEDKDIRDREVWTAVSRHWYSKASDKAPKTGRLYHHLAILARPNALQQLFFYTKSLCVPIPFSSAKESIMTLFNPILGVNTNQHNCLDPVDVALVKTHGILFSHKQLENFHLVASEFLGQLNGYIERIGKAWMKAGSYIAIANCCALLSYGKEDNVLMRAIHSESNEKQDQGVEGSETRILQLSRDFENALHLAMGTHKIVFKRWDDVNVLPYTHIVMVFMFYLIRLPNALQHVEHLFPWKLLSLMLNRLLKTYDTYERIRSDKFPREKSNDPSRPVPEDFALKGLLFVESYYPDWFANDNIDDDEKYFEMASMTDVRKERILWLGHKIAQYGRGLTYDKGINEFGVFPEYEKEIEEISKDADIMSISNNHGIGSQTPNSALLREGRDEMDVDEAPTTSIPIVSLLH